MIDNCRRVESELNYSRSQTERILSQKNQIEKEIKNIQNKYIILEKTHKESL